jgi:hypothetical protein
MPNIRLYCWHSLLELLNRQGFQQMTTALDSGLRITLANQPSADFAIILTNQLRDDGETHAEY